MYWWNRFVEFDRKPLDSQLLQGFVVQFSDLLTLVSPLDDERFELNGYTVVRNSEIRRWRPVDENSFYIRALRLKGVKPIRKRGLSLANWPELLRSANKLFPLVTIRRERLNGNACQIGRIISLNRVAFELEEIDTDASWCGRYRYKFSDVTCVAFGGGYEDALARVAAAKFGAARPSRRAQVDGPDPPPVKKRPVR